MKLTVSEIKDLLGISQELEIAHAYVTPQIAEKILAENNDHNRKLRKNDVQFLSGQFAREEYFLSTSCLGFNSEGTLTDGQHRLTAIAMQEEGTEFKIGVMFNVEHAMGMDTGRKRTLKENAELFVGSFDENENEARIICLDILKEVIANCNAKRTQVKLSQKQYLDVYDALKDKFRICYDNGIIEKRKNYPAAVQSALFIAYCDGVDMQVLKYISEKLKNESNTFNGTTDNPIYALIKKLGSIKGGGNAPATERHLLTQDCIYRVSIGSTSNRLSSSSYRFSISQELPHIR